MIKTALCLLAAAALIFVIVQARHGTRGARVVPSWLVIALPVMALTTYSLALLYTTAAGISMDGDLRAHPVHLFAFCVFLLSGIGIGLFLGGWLWSRVAYHLFRLSKADFELLLINPRFKAFNRQNQKAIDRLFGDRA